MPIELLVVLLAGALFLTGKYGLPKPSWSRKAATNQAGAATTAPPSTTPSVTTSTIKRLTQSVKLPLVGLAALPLILIWAIFLIFPGSLITAMSSTIMLILMSMFGIALIGSIFVKGGRMGWVILLILYIATAWNPPSVTANKTQVAGQTIVNQGMQQGFAAATKNIPNPIEMVGDTHIADLHNSPAGERIAYDFGPNDALRVGLSAPQCTVFWHPTDHWLSLHGNEPWFDPAGTYLRRTKGSGTIRQYELTDDFEAGLRAKGVHLQLRVWQQCP